MLKALATLSFIALAGYGAVTGKNPALVTGTLAALLVYFSGSTSPFEGT